MGMGIGMGMGMGNPSRYVPQRRSIHIRRFSEAGNLLSSGIYGQQLQHHFKLDFKANLVPQHVMPEAEHPQLDEYLLMADGVSTFEEEGDCHSKPRGTPPTCAAPDALLKRRSVKTRCSSAKSCFSFFLSSRRPTRLHAGKACTDG